MTDESTHTSLITSDMDRNGKKRTRPQRIRRKFNKTFLKCISDSGTDTHSSTAVQVGSEDFYITPTDEVDHLDEGRTEPYYVPNSSSSDGVYKPIGSELNLCFEDFFDTECRERMFAREQPVKLDAPTNPELDECEAKGSIPDEGTPKSFFGSQEAEKLDPPTVTELDLYGANGGIPTDGMPKACSSSLGAGNDTSLNITENRDSIGEATKSYEDFMHLVKDIGISGSSPFAAGPTETYTHPAVVKAKQASQIVVEGVSQYINRNAPGLAGTVLETGSFHDRTKVGEACEFDYMHELHGIPIIPELKFADVLFFDIYSNGYRLNSFDLYEEFAKHALEALRAMELPEGVEHHGFYSPEFSGIRNSGPSITILLLVKFEDTKQKITVDLTPALPVSVVEMGRLLPTRTLELFEKWFDGGVPQIHFIPTDTRVLWTLSTAYLDVGFMNRVCAADGKARRIIRAVKRLADKLLTIRHEEDYKSLMATIFKILHIKGEPASDNPERAEYFLCYCQLSQICGENSQEEVQYVEYLRSAMRKKWKALNPAILGWANEICPAYVSVRSCAIKYLVIEDIILHDLDDEDVSPLSLDEIRTVLKSLSTCREINHPFLGTPVKTKSVTSFHAYQKVDKPLQLLDAHDALLFDLMEKLSFLQRAKHSDPVENPHQSPTFRVTKVVSVGLDLWYKLRHVL